MSLQSIGGQPIHPSIIRIGHQTHCDTAAYSMHSRYSIALVQCMPRQNLAIIDSYIIFD